MNTHRRRLRQLTDAATISAALFPLALSAVMAFDRYDRRRRQIAREHNRAVIAAELGLGDGRQGGDRS